MAENRAKSPDCSSNRPTKATRQKKGTKSEKNNTAKNGHDGRKPRNENKKATAGPNSLQTLSQRLHHLSEEIKAVAEQLMAIEGKESF